MSKTKNNIPLAKDIMSSPVTSVTLSHSVRQVLQLTRDKQVSGFPIIDMEGRAVGVISTFDLITEESLGKDHLKLAELPLAIKVEKDVIQLTQDTPIKEALLLFIKHGVGRIIITDEKKVVCGIISRKDVVNFFLDRHFNQSSRDDEHD